MRSGRGVGGESCLVGALASSECLQGRHLQGKRAMSGLCIDRSTRVEREAGMGHTSTDMLTTKYSSSCHEQRLVLLVNRGGDTDTTT